jgi:hypothetical protein
MTHRLGGVNRARAARLECFYKVWLDGKCEFNAIARRSFRAWGTCNYAMTHVSAHARVDFYST